MAFTKGNQFRFKKGNTQASGKAKREKLTVAIHKKTKAGKELVEFFYKVFTGEIEGNAGNTGPPSLKMRIHAAEWLTDRGFGRTPAVEEEGSQGIKIQIVQYSDPDKQPEAKVIDGNGEDDHDTPQLPPKELPEVSLNGTGTGVQEDGVRLAPEGGEGLDLYEPDDKGDVEESGGLLVSSSNIRPR